jgi:Predicted phosphoesterases, related to the Icc protein
VAVIHTPPLNTKADRLGSGVSVGSPAVRRFLERAQPEVCLTGHIHESRAEDRLGRTLILNPGMLAHGGYVRLDYEDGRLSARLLSVD